MTLEDADSGRNEYDAGVDLHEWETRWAELEPMLRESPVETLPDAADLVTQMLQETHWAPEGQAATAEELAVRYQEARTVAERLSAGEEVDVFEIGQAAEALRELQATILEERSGLSSAAR